MFSPRNWAKVKYYPKGIAFLQKKLQLDAKKSAKEEAISDEPVSFENLESFRQGLRDLIQKGESDPTIKSAIIKTIVHRILILKDGFEIHFHVGQTHYLALGNSPGASFFVSFSTSKYKKPSAGLPTEGSILESICPESRNFKVSGSRRLTNGGGNRDRTCDLLNANQMLSQLSYAPVSNTSVLKWLTNAIPVKRLSTFLAQESIEL
jgi:hypothetical protein